MSTLSVQPLVKPIFSGGVRIRMVSVVLAAGTIYWFFCCLRILSEGLTTLGIDTYGATWGILVANTVHIIGISHVGIAISAAVRVLRLERYRPITRTAEIVTLIALATAVINLLLHVGRPERFIVNAFLYGKWHSALVWSMTVFTLYFMASSVYLYLSLRRDIWLMSTVAPRRRGLYRFLSFGYRDSSEVREQHERTLFWLALCLIPIMVSVHSVYGLLFGLISAKVGWYNPLQAPYFVLGAIVSGFSAILAIAAVLRRAYAWESLLTDRLFRVFGAFLAFVVFLYLYFMLSEHLTAQYSPGTAEKVVSDSLLRGRFSGLFWATTIGGLVIPFFYLLLQGVKPTRSNVGLIAVAAVLVNVALWLKRYLLVVPAQYHASLPGARAPVEYVPTYTEWIATLGSYVAAAFVFTLLLRFLPLFELPTPAKATIGEDVACGSRTRRWVVGLTLITGLSMIAWGVTTREYDYAPIKWLIGLGMLVAIPLESCFIVKRHRGNGSEPDARVGISLRTETEP